MNDKTYNGWTNWETWNLARWIDNDHDIYLQRVKAQKKLGEWTARTIDKFAYMYLGPEGTPDFDEGDRDKVNWREIAENFNEERFD